MSESDILHPYLLRDVLEDAIKQMEILLQKYNEGADAEYYKGYKSGIEFSKEKVEQMWEQWKARTWSDGIDERDFELAKESCEMEK